MAASTRKPDENSRPHSFPGARHVIDLEPGDRRQGRSGEVGWIATDTGRVTSGRSLHPPSITRVRQCWARRVGVSDTANETSIRRGRDDAIVVVRIADALLVLAPAAVADAVSDWPGERLLDPAALMAAAGRDGRVLGPASLAYADAGSLVVPDGAAVALDLGDQHLALFAATLTTEEWDESGLGGNLARRFGVAVGDALVAVAGYEVWDKAIAHLCVASSVSARRQGHAKAAAYAAASDAISAGLVGQWRSAVANRGSAAVGEALGFVPLGEQLTILFDSS